MQSVLPAEKRAAVQRAILAWYRRGHRDLPWRATRDPYYILVSEVMLQQTQVDRVLPKYLGWLMQYPTLEALAAAPRAEVIRAWSGLGYNLRAVRLHEIARQVVEHHGGRLPKTLDGLLSLKGIGRYTAAAVMCFAHDAPEPVLDTNVRRVLGRIFAREVPGATEDDRLAWPLAAASLPPETDTYDWNQALMDVGATICLSRTPRCLLCPAQAECTARQVFFAPGEGEMSLAVAEDRASYAAATQKRTRKPAAVAERFDGSRRWYRGQIVEALRALPDGGSLVVTELASSLEIDDATVRALVVALERDGLAVTQGDGDAATVALPL